MRIAAAPRFASRVGRIPLGPKIVKRISSPDSFRLFPPNTIKKVMRAAPRPFGPTLHISMMNWIVVDIVHRSPKMSFRTNSAITGAIKDLSSAKILFTVPGEGRCAMQSPQFCEQDLGRIRLDESVVMIRQNAPRMHDSARLLKGSEQSEAKQFIRSAENPICEACS
jgi:hypothetical protein